MSYQPTLRPAFDITSVHIVESMQADGTWKRELTRFYIEFARDEARRIKRETGKETRIMSRALSA